MTRKEWKEALPIIQAYAEGKTIQFWCEETNIWQDLREDISFCFGTDYRVKPEPKYRPFKNTEECWEEMQKHQPFGWLMRKGHRYLITSMTDNQGVFCVGETDNLSLTGFLNEGWTFADGTPFGIKED